MNISATALQANFALILADWSETLTVKRSTVVYGAAGSTETWATVGTTVQGAWQPISGAAQRAEAGMQVKSDAQLFFAVGTDVQDGDRIYRASGEWGTARYHKTYPDHLTFFLTKTTGEPS